MSVYLTFVEYVEGQDPIGDFIERKARKIDEAERLRYPFAHLSVLISNPPNRDMDYGFYRADCLRTGVQYSHSWDLPKGDTFVLDLSLSEAEVFFRAWHPSATEKYRTSLMQTRKQLRGATHLPPNLETGEMNCVTFCLLVTGRLDLPHRIPELYRALQKEGSILIRNKGKEQDGK